MSNKGLYISDEVNGFVTDCDNPGKINLYVFVDGSCMGDCSTVFFHATCLFLCAGLFKAHLNCCPLKHCPANYFPFHLYSGVADVVAAKICLNNTM